MEIRQIRYFITVAEIGNVSRAAERLFITQPALTRQIQALERELGVSLFERKSRRLSLTYAGEVLLTRTRPLLEELAQTNSIMHELSRGATEILRVAAGPLPMRNVVLPAVAKFRERRPQIHIQLLEAGYGLPMSLVEHDDADLAVAAPWAGSQELLSELLYTPRLYALLSPEHHLADRAFLSVEELTREDLLLIRASQATQLAREFLLHLHGLERASVFESDLSDTILRAAELQFGVAITVDSVPYHDYALKAIPVLDGDRQVEFKVAVAWRKRRGLSKTFKELIQLLKEYGAQRQTTGYSPWQSARAISEAHQDAL